MKTVAPPVDWEEADEISPTPLTADQVRRLRERSPSLSPWQVVMGQMVVGAIVAALAWAWSGKQDVGWSAAYGALTVSIPAAVFAWGLTGRIASRDVGTAAAASMGWEMVKVVLTVAMLAAAPRLVAGLSWPAMLIGLVATMQVYWIALAYSPGNTVSRKRKLRVE